MESKELVKILIVDDEQSIRSILRDSLEDEGYRVSTASNGEEGLRAIREQKPHIVLLDIWMPGRIDGIEVLQEAQNLDPKTDFIVMSGHGSIETAVKATKLGAWDFVEKPLSMDRILILLKNILLFQRQKAEREILLNRLRQDIALVGSSEAMVKIKQQISRQASCETWCLVTGAPGTGKELVASNIHFLSSRAGGVFTTINCQAIPEELLGAEIFGIEKGASVGILETKRGKLELSSGGTVLLKNVGFLPPEIQRKLVEVMRKKSACRIGGEKEIPIDVRIIVSGTVTNTKVGEIEGRPDFMKNVEQGVISSEFYQCFNQMKIDLPPLQERMEDIPALVHHFGQGVSRLSGYELKEFSENSLRRLKLYPWPGNVRELQNFVERVYILTPGHQVETHDLNFAGLPRTPMEAVAQRILNFKEARAQFEKEYLVRKIDENKGNISRTAEMIGLERSYLHRKIKSYGLDV